MEVELVPANRDIVDGACNRGGFTAPLELSGLAFPAPSGPREGRRYELKVIQQPLRARMCGFGDKDRRPATPPPIIELIVRDKNGRLIDVPNSDVSFFVLKCDLYSADGTKDRNLVVHPSVTAAARVAARQLEAAAEAAALEKSHADPATTATESSHPHVVLIPRMPTARAATGAVIRNLVGCLMASAAKLTRLPASRAAAAAETGDAGPIMGIYFVLQDLSIRTEGSFKFKFSFLDLSDGEFAVTTGVTNVQKVAFSDQFTVYSAKNFPGMIESTPLSTWFSRQGVKIHARRDTTMRRRRASQQAEGDGAAPDVKRHREQVADSGIARGILAPVTAATAAKGALKGGYRGPNDSEHVPRAPPAPATAGGNAGSTSTGDTGGPSI